MNTHAFSRIIGAGLALVLCAGCGESDAGNPSDGSAGASGGGTGGGGGASASSCGSADNPFLTFAAEAQNYTFQSSLHLEVQKVAPKTLLDFDWSGLTRNFQGHALSPTADIDSVVLIVWNITPEELAEKINADNGDLTSYVQGTVQFETENLATSAQLSEFTAFGSPVPEATLLEYLDPELNDPATHSYTLMAQAGTQLGVGAQMIQAFQLDPAETNTTVTVSDASTMLDWEADLGTLTPTLVPAGQPGILVNWSRIETRGFGGEFVPNRITEVLIGRLSASLAEIEQDFLNLEFVADDIWRGTVPSGVSLNLEELLHQETLEPFPGVAASDTWILGLLCTTCTNPTPWYITRVETCP